MASAICFLLLSAEHPIHCRSQAGKTQGGDRLYLRLTLLPCKPLHHLRFRLTALWQLIAQSHPKHISQVNSVSICILADLFPTTEAVGDDEGFLGCVTNGWQ